MPLLTYKCRECEESFRYLQTPTNFSCPKCSGHIYRTPTGPTTQTIEVKDNGRMTKAIRQIQNLEEIIQERSKNDSPKKN